MSQIEKITERLFQQGMTGDEVEEVMRNEIQPLLKKFARPGKVDALLGLQWGDEGKGGKTDILAIIYDVVARFQGGPNAGHTIEFNGKKYVLHNIPSGIFHEDIINIVGNGVLVESYIFKDEVEKLRKDGIEPTKNLFISKKAHLILPTHRLLDAANEFAKGDSKIGTTNKGIGPTYTDKVARIGLRVGDIMESNFLERYKQLKERHLQTAISLGYDVSSFNIDEMTFEQYEEKWMESLETLKKFRLIDEYFINECLDKGLSVLAEGAQGTMLDIDFGSYPYVTSSNTITAGVCTGLGIAPSSIGEVIGIVKAYCTRVGAGPFPTELFDQTGLTLCEIGQEYGATTGRKRRCGWIDIVALRYACMLNGVTYLFITKADVMNDFDDIYMCTEYEIDGERTDKITFNYNTANIKPVYERYEGWNQPLTNYKSYDELPEKLLTYLNAIEKELRVPIIGVSINPTRNGKLWNIKNLNTDI